MHSGRVGTELFCLDPPILACQYFAPRSAPVGRGEARLTAMGAGEGMATCISCVVGSGGAERSEIAGDQWTAVTRQSGDVLREGVDSGDADRPGS
jgi:hypothetical protein